MKQLTKGDNFVLIEMFARSTEKEESKNGYINNLLLVWICFTRSNSMEHCDFYWLDAIWRREEHLKRLYSGNMILMLYQMILYDNMLSDCANDFI